MSQNKLKITHKELLTFSNLANLEWEFAKIRITDENGDIITGEGEEYKKLDDLLVNPEVFVSGYKDPEKKEEPIYEYGGVDENGNHNTEQGLAQMRKEAGVAMEYLEKKDIGKKEGKFLENWEVVYAADNYKVVEDYLDNLYSVYKDEPEFADFELNEDGELYPSREKVESKRNLIKGVKVGFVLLDGVLSIMVTKGDLDDIITSQTKNKLLKEVGTELTVSQMQKLINKTDSVPLKLLSAAYLGKGSGFEKVFIDLKF